MKNKPRINGLLALIGLLVLGALLMPIVSANDLGTDSISSGSSAIASSQPMSITIGIPGHSIMPMTPTNFWYGSNLTYNRDYRMLTFSSREWTDPPTYTDMQIQSTLQRLDGVNWVDVTSTAVISAHSISLQAAGTYFAPPGHQTYRTHGHHSVYTTQGWVTVDSYTGQLTT